MRKENKYIPVHSSVRNPHYHCPKIETNFLTLDAKYRFPQDRNTCILIHGLVYIIQGDPFFKHNSYVFKEYGN